METKEKLLAFEDFAGFKFWKKSLKNEL